MGLMVAVASMAPQLDCRQDAAPVRAVRAVATGIIDADNARDLERVLRHYTADAILMPPGEAAVPGRSASAVMSARACRHTALAAPPTSSVHVRNRLSF